MLILNRLSGFGAGGRASLTEITLVDESASNYITTISVPSGVQAGDLIILADYANDNSVPTKVIPPGFTEIASPNDGSSTRFTVSYKIADGTETSITGQDGSEFVKRLAILRGDKPIASVSAGGVQTEGPTDSNPAGISITASSGAAPLLVVGFYGNVDTTIDPRSFTPAADDEAGSTNVWMKWRFDAASPQNTTVDMDDEGYANTLIACYLELGA